MVFRKILKRTIVTDEERELQARIKKVHRKLFPWTFLNIIPGILIGYFTWFYYVKVVLDKRIVIGGDGFENVLGFLLLYIAPVISILGLISISVTIIAKLTYRPIIMEKFYEERQVILRLWNTSVIVNTFATLATLVMKCLV
jgi:hypothetical protein